MEVHHHSHPAAAGHRKRWAHYFWEFFMLFLAVTLGFFVENQREHMVNKKNEKKLMLALQKDLVKDTVRLHKLISDYTPAFHSWIDSCHYDIDSLSLKGNESRIGKALFNATVWDVYSVSEVAGTILKNPAAFNLVENETVKKDILNVSVAVNDYEKYSALIDGLHHGLDTAFASLVNREACRQYLDGLAVTLDFLSDRNIPHNVIFKTYDKAAFLKYVNLLDQMDFKIHDLQYFYIDILKQDLKLYRAIVDEYHLKE